VSHALSRLRVNFQDDLFVRAGSVMAPTPTGERVAQGAINALALVQQEIWDVKAFDPLTTTRIFSVCLSDMGMIVLLPKLLGVLRVHAPNATLNPIQVPSLELASALQDGAIDLAIGYLGKMGDNLYQQTLFRRSLVGIIRTGKRSPNTGKSQPMKMSLEQFVDREHVLAGTLSMTNQLLEEELRHQGERLKVGVSVPYLLTVPGLVATSDYIACVPSELADLFAKLADVCVFELPVKLPDLTVKQFWHARFHNDGAHRWFRSLVAQTLGDLSEQHR
jgi:DNA-binding transcriptional LysR family regulator